MSFMYHKCKSLIYSDHAINQMFKRDISTGDIREVLRVGEVIVEYPNDQPFPSSLIMGMILGRPIHLVVAINEIEKKCVIVTAYEPDPRMWDKNFKQKIK